MYINMIGSVFWSLLSIAHYGTFLNGNLVSGFLAAQSGLAASLLVLRRTPAIDSNKSQQIVAWGSALLPLTLKAGEHMVGSILAGVGLLISIWASVSLRFSFGIAPADRGLVSSGPYRFLRHPMYAGELISVIGAVLGWWTLWNLALVILLGITLVYRIRWEEQIVSGYGEYKRHVCWKMVPGVW